MSQRFDAAVRFLDAHFGQAIEVKRVAGFEAEIGNYHVGLNGDCWCVWELSEDFPLLAEYDDPVEAVCHALSLAAPDALAEMMIGVCC